MTRRRKKQLKIERDLIFESESESRQRMCGSKKQYNSDLEALAWGRKANEDTIRKLYGILTFASIVANGI